jgi:hypothetical protein
MEAILGCLLSGLGEFILGMSIEGIINHRNI